MWIKTEAGGLWFGTSLYFRLKCKEHKWVMTFPYPFMSESCIGKLSRLVLPFGDIHKRRHHFFHCTDWSSFSVTKILCIWAISTFSVWQNSSKFCPKSQTRLFRNYENLASQFRWCNWFLSSILRISFICKIIIWLSTPLPPPLRWMTSFMDVVLLFMGFLCLISFNENFYYC